jgi:hypothetical protein
MAAAMDSPSQAPGRWSKIAPLFAVLFVAFVVASVFVTNPPASDASPISILHYYRTHKNQVSISAVLIPPAVVFGLIWFSYLRSWLQRRDVDHRWGTISFAGGILFAATGGVAGGALAALGDSPDHLTLSSAQTLNYLQNDMPAILASMAFGVMAISAGIAMLRSAVLPRWLGWVSLILGILGVVPIGDFFALPAIGVWTLIVAGVVYFRTDPDGPLVVQTSSNLTQVATT